MQLEIPIEELRQRKLFVAMPCYGGMMCGTTARSLIDLAVACVHYGIELKTYFLFNESLITRARTYATDEFMRSDCTHMMFIDSDIGFKAQDVLALLALQGPDSPYDVISGAYPKKCIAWEKIKMAVDKGFADQNPQNLEHFVGDYVFNPIVDGNTTMIRLDQPVQISEAGTGFMMIRRETIQKFEAAYPELKFRPDHVRTENFDGTREIFLYFQAEVDPESKRYLSEDYWFCKKVRDQGMQVWLCPWIELTHTGTYTFGGSLAALAAVGASATAETNAPKIKSK
jgi:hypothetical protein